MPKIIHIPGAKQTLNLKQIIRTNGLFVADPSAGGLVRWYYYTYFVWRGFSLTGTNEGKRPNPAQVLWALLQNEELARSRQWIATSTVLCNGERIRIGCSKPCVDIEVAPHGWEYHIPIEEDLRIR